MKKSHARIASAWERRNCDQVGPVCRRAGIDAAGLEDLPDGRRCDLNAQAGQLAVDPAVPPVGVLASQPADQGPDVPPGRWSAGPAAHGPGGPAAADDVAVPAHDRVRGDQQPQPLAARFRYHAEQGCEQSPVRPVQLRPSRLPPLQDGELVAQDQDLRGLPRLLTPRQPQPRGDPRDQEEREVGPRARCRCCHRSSPASPLPHPPCDSHRNGRSACLTRWSAARWRLLVSGSTGSGCCCRDSGSVSP